MRKGVCTDEVKRCASPEFLLAFFPPLILLRQLLASMEYCDADENAQAPRAGLVLVRRQKNSNICLYTVFEMTKVGSCLSLVNIRS